MCFKFLFVLLIDRHLIANVILKGMQRLAACGIGWLCFCEFFTISSSCAEQVADFAQNMLIFVLPLIFTVPHFGLAFLPFSSFSAEETICESLLVNNNYSSFDRIMC